MRVFLYRNLHKHQYSVRDESIKRVIFHAHDVLVKDAKLVVGQAGRRRVLREGRKNVHAGVRGSFVASGPKAKLTKDSDWRELYYNPYKVSQFVDKQTGEAVTEASLVYLGPDGVWAKGTNGSA